MSRDVILPPALFEALGEVTASLARLFDGATQSVPQLKWRVRQTVSDVRQAVVHLNRWAEKAEALAETVAPPNRAAAYEQVMRFAPRMADRCPACGGERKTNSFDSDYNFGACTNAECTDQEAGPRADREVAK